ncbi:NADP-dependent isocitrate dehydrogenase [Azospirillum thermophilum]|uniref:Isocitrate dehydrogenase [NADP] n=1 Tax=Azospirillum thermophilum TaxID=2202148 RepID=A0A2S2CRY9_9PROT|nr:NADP-dependent isocitrate dehydrogenase [Azospirillum thermophilum]AWK87274.1 NADP-dependent isocitrate dehydrogenase [Azospirillum thermophilum]
MRDITPITVARGDGIGPEITDAVLYVMNAAGARLKVEEVPAGEMVYRRGYAGGLDESGWGSIRRTRVFLKGPITTPQGYGNKSLNVTARTTLGLFANVRPCVSYHPYVRTRHPRMDVVIIRENEEDLYAGIEHRQTDDVIQSVKLISRPGSERIVRYAFDYARSNHRQKVTAFVKDNVMKMTDGLFLKVFYEVATEYPEIKADHLIVDIGAARLADQPERFDVIVTLNLYGDIVSDIAAQITGSVGLAGSANIGDTCAMFEAIHGSAPMIAGQGIANPSGLLMAAVMMLVHIGQGDAAALIHNAWLKAIEDGVHTADIFSRGLSRVRAGTMAFAQAVVERLGQMPVTLPSVGYATSHPAYYDRVPRLSPRSIAHKEIVGVDVFLQWSGGTPADLAGLIGPLATEALDLSSISNRSQRVWPEGNADVFCTDHWRCRFVARHGTAKHADIVDLLGRLAEAGIDFTQTENLCNFDGKAGYSTPG